MRAPTLDAGTLAEWAAYEFRNQRANAAYVAQSSFPCRHPGCDNDFSHRNSRSYHENRCPHRPAAGATG